MCGSTDEISHKSATITSLPPVPSAHVIEREPHRGRIIKEWNSQ